MLDDDLWPIVIFTIVGLVIGGYFGTQHGRKNMVENFCRWKYEKYVDAESCELEDMPWEVKSGQG